MKLRKAEDMTMDELYAEQEELFNAPIETLEEYRNRVAHTTGSQNAGVFATHSFSYRPPSNGMHQFGTNDLQAVLPPTGRNIKRKPSEPQIETAEKRTKTTDQHEQYNEGMTSHERPFDNLVLVNLDGQHNFFDRMVAPYPMSLTSHNKNLTCSDVSHGSPRLDFSTRTESLPLGEVQPSEECVITKQIWSPSRDRSPTAKTSIDPFDMNTSSSSSQIARNERVAPSHPRSPQIDPTTASLKRSSETLDETLDDIDSFTNEINTPVIAAPKRRVEAIKKTQATLDIISPIASFSQVERVVEKHCRPPTVYSAQLPLDLHPLAEAEKPTNKRKLKPGRSLIPSVSPIEDDTVVKPPAIVFKEVIKKSRLSQVTTKMAQHTTSSRPDKILKQYTNLDGETALSDSGPLKSADGPVVVYVSSSPSSRASSPTPAPSEVSKKVDKASTKPPPNKRQLKGKKEKPQPMTPFEYAQMLQDKAAEKISTELTNNEGPSSKPIARKKKSTTVRFLDGKNIFYTGGDMKNASETTRGRMNIIVKFGGNLMPRFDPKATTHILTDAAAGPTLRALALKSLKQIPEHIPTVKWTWVLSVIGKETSLTKDEIDRKLNETWQHAAFRERMDAGYRPQKTVSLASFKDKQKGKALGSRNVPPNLPVLQSTSGPSHITQLPLPLPSSTLLSPPASPNPTSHQDRGVKEANDPNIDPLAEFYPVAKSEILREDGWSSLGEFDESPNESDESEGPDVSHGAVRSNKRGWTCDTKVQTIDNSPNQDIIEKLTELMNLHKAKVGDEDHWRAFSYNRSIRALRSYPRRIKTYEQARSIKGVGEKTARKIEEILQTGDLQRIQYENTEDVAVTSLFQGIYGVGQSTALQWFAAGCRSLDDLRDGKGNVKLSPAQQIGLQFYDDINTRMPREEAKTIFDLIKPIALSLDSKLYVEIMGSYRRGKQTCGDIDVLLTRSTEDGQTHSGVLPRLLHALHKAGILTKDLAIPDNPDDLEAVYRGLCTIPGSSIAKQRRIDFLCLPWTSRGAALIYYTGDDIFNRAMRLKANVMGYSLNQRGLFGSIVRDPRDRRIKLSDGVLVASETEEEIFKILKVPWQEPHERIRG
ncbi:hypothetical protein CPB83DRAFT_851735 [Crepidotus variabilis]|uniref:DNA polymerase lambda n=1 Tax=Crepidotus variabilis TaxID=179855 RepID=A0A9P6JR37_9AGAR|nr:hypothetical protein CPB83DRAFT_851735 [Crepidotus variabilis]